MLRLNAKGERTQVEFLGTCESWRRRGGSCIAMADGGQAAVAPHPASGRRFNGVQSRCSAILVLHLQRVRGAGGARSCRASEAHAARQPGMQMTDKRIRVLRYGSAGRDRGSKPPSSVASPLSKLEKRGRKGDRGRRAFAF